jgi:hypothetical protein
MHTAKVIHRQVQFRHAASEARRVAFLIIGFTALGVSKQNQLTRPLRRFNSAKPFTIAVSDWGSDSYIPRQAATTSASAKPVEPPFGIYHIS